MQSSYSSKFAWTTHPHSVTREERQRHVSCQILATLRPASAMNATLRRTHRHVPSAIVPISHRDLQSHFQILTFLAQRNLNAQSTGTHALPCSLMCKMRTTLTRSRPVRMHHSFKCTDCDDRVTRTHPFRSAFLLSSPSIRLAPLIPQLASPRHMQSSAYTTSHQLGAVQCPRSCSHSLLRYRSPSTQATSTDVASSEFSAGRHPQYALASGR